MKTYLVTVRYPSECEKTVYVDWIEVKARTEKEAQYKARVKASRWISTPVIKEIK